MKNRSITLYRSELVWQDSHLEWDESDYQKYLDWLKSFKDKQNTDWERNNYAFYLFLKDYSWDEICYWFEHEGEDEPKMLFHSKTHDGDEGYSWSTSLTDIIKEVIREDLFNCADVDDEHYADDWQEDWDINQPTEENDD